jgi:hypothetical protein
MKQKIIIVCLWVLLAGFLVNERAERIALEATLVEILSDYGGRISVVEGSSKQIIIREVSPVVRQNPTGLSVPTEVVGPYSVVKRR